MPGLGLSLRDILMGGNPAGDPLMPAPSPQPPPQAPAGPKPMSKGQMIAGIIADMLAGAQGRQGSFAPMLNQRKQQEQEQAQWGLRRQADLEDYEAKQKIEQRYKLPEVPPMLRDVQTYMGMDEPQRQAWQQMNDMKRGDPDVFVTLPNGQVYAGPKSGLAAALTGGTLPAAPAAPVGKLRPLNGGPTPPASGTFRPSY